MATNYPASAIPAGMNAAELDVLYAQLTVQGEAAKQAYIRNYCPPYLQPGLAYVQGNPSSTSSAKTASGAVTANAATLVGITCNTPGTGTLNINNAATLGGSNASNQVFSKPATEMVANQTIILNIECPAGITISSMPASGNYTIIYNPTPT